MSAETEKAHNAGILVGAFAENYEHWKHRKLNWAALLTDTGGLFKISREAQKRMHSAIREDSGMNPS